MPSLKDLKGTHKESVAPWDSYESELCPKIKDPMLEAAVAEYESRPYHQKSSNQNIEEAHRQKEISWDMSREYRWLKLDEYKDEESRLIDLLHPAAFLRKLTGMGLNCWYAGEPWNGRVALYAKKGSGEDTFVSAVPCSTMPAFSVMRFDSHGIPLDEKYRGYWTVLLRLIIDEFVTEDQTIAAFGIPRGPGGEVTRRMLYNVRNRNKY